MMLHFFFFQAEDGIRDYKVTGVQTCALPILPPAVGVVAFDFNKDGWMDLAFTHASPPGISLWRNVDGKNLERVALADFGRSEERRVGKECRSRWSPYH